MKIALIHNLASGRRVSPESLRAALTAEGHELVRVVAHDAVANGVTDSPAELVVAAGGDGTVADAARAVAGRGVPLAIVPIGTANNIALTLGIGGPIAQLAAGWHRATAQSFDIGVLDGGGGPRRFVEGAGGGLVEACMSAIQRRPLRAGEPPPWALVRALRRYAQSLARLRPRRWSLRLDGTPHGGDLLLVEVLNTRSVGPNLELAPEASPFDGRLTVVMARESDRGALAAYIADRLAGREGRLDLPTETARCIDIVDARALHVDDELVRFPPGANVSMRVLAGAVQVLVPPV